MPKIVNTQPVSRGEWSPGRTEDFHEHIQRQLVEVLRGQDKLERMVAKLTSLSGFPNNVSLTPRADFYQISPPGGDALDSVSSNMAVLNTDGETDQQQSLLPASPRSVADLLQPTTLDKAIFDQLEVEEVAARSALDRKKKRLETLLKTNREAKAKEAQKEQVRKEKLKQGAFNAFLAVEAEKQHLILDAVSGAVILLNTIFIGFSLDYKNDSDWNAWLLVDMGFVLLFLVELVTKLVMHVYHARMDWRGVGDYFIGHDGISNAFDAALVVLDVVQLSVALREVGEGGEKHRSAAVLRIVRLIRMVRIVRLLRLKIMRSFVEMMQGMIDGLSTLFWAVVLFVLMVYACGILCRICFGSDISSERNKVVHPYFNSVSRSMLTVFRCCFGDCSTVGGMPIPEFIVEENGSEYALAYCLFVFFITIGLFNIISAIFVDSTMTASADAKTRNKNNRLHNNKLWAMNVATILTELLKQKNSEEGCSVTPDTMERDIEKLIKIEFNRSEIDKVVKNNRYVIQALDNLDIESQDHDYLSDILDPDHSGFIDVLELVEGLRRLRGDPRRSDVVSVNLMIRSLQAKSDEMLQEVMEVKKLQLLTEREIETSIK